MARDFLLTTSKFPRARVFVDEQNLKLTSECSQFLSSFLTESKMVERNVSANMKANTNGSMNKTTAAQDLFYQLFGSTFQHPQSDVIMLT